MPRCTAALLLACLACAATPAAPVPAPGRSGAWGYVTLVPREGVKPGGHGAASYGDRRLRDVRFVDYSAPGFAVVYVPAASAPAGVARIQIVTTRVATRLEPSHAAVGARGTLVVENTSAQTHVVSYPAAQRVVRLAPGESVELPVPRAGEQSVFLLDVPDGASTVFAAPGPFARVATSGRYELTDLAPGARELRAWHPRFPQAARRVELAPDVTRRVDLEIGVGRGAAAGGRAGAEATGHTHAP